MTDYPNREHRAADDGARRRALNIIPGMVEQLQQIERKVQNGHEVDGADTQSLANGLTYLTINLSQLEILAEVREWHEMDMAGIPENPDGGGI